MGDATLDLTERRPVVYLTAFGPFPPYSVNASEAAVNSLDIERLGKELGVKIYREVLKVEYDSVGKIVNKRWAELDPKLAVHVGVSGQAETLVVEQVAHRSGYKKNDVCGCCPSGGMCCLDGEEVIQSGIRMDLVTKALNKDTTLKLSCCKSTDPGRFLCDFIYYTSLKQDKSRAAFIHVPTLNKYTQEDISAAIAVAIKEMYRQVVENDQRESMKVDSVP